VRLKVIMKIRLLKECIGLKSFSRSRRRELRKRQLRNRIDRIRVESYYAPFGGSARSSLRVPREDFSVAARPQISFGTAMKMAEDRYEITSAEAVAELRARLGTSI
jgi:hypothetical protein